MAALPFMPLYVADFFASTDGWPAPARGLYLLLLARQWDKGSAGDGPEYVRRWAAVRPREWNRVWKLVGPKFEHTDRGLINSKLEAIRAQALERYADKSAKARSAALARWNAPAMQTHMQTHSGRNAPSNADAMPPIQTKSIRPPQTPPPVDNSARRAAQPLGPAPRNGNEHKPKTTGADSWALLLASDGKLGRTPTVERAIQAVGGWQAIRMRTPANQEGLRAAFCSVVDAG